MTADHMRAIEDSAIHWHVRLRDANVSEWEAFEAWLSESPEHLVAYTSVSVLDDDVDAALLPRSSHLALVANEDTRPRAGRRWWIAGGSVAAGALLTFLTVPTFMSSSSQYEIATAPGQQRSINFGDGTQITLNGATKLRLDRNDKRFAALDAGEATFSVRHDASHPFVLDVAGVRVRDTGTVFNVVRAPEGVTVEVSAGSVVYDVDKEAVPVKAGQALNAPTGSTKIVVTPKRPESIATWREGRLDYDMQTFPTIARDLSRNLGTTVVVDPALTEKRFSGTITLERDHPRFFARLGALLGVKVRRDGTAWRMSVR